MAVPIEQLCNEVVSRVVLEIETARAKLNGKHQILTLPPEISFQVEVVFDGYVDGDETHTVMPDQETVTTKGAEESRTVQAPQVTRETQTTKHGQETSVQAFGRETTVQVEETT